VDVFWEDQEAQQAAHLKQLHRRYSKVALSIGDDAAVSIARANIATARNPETRSVLLRAAIVRFRTCICSVKAPSQHLPQAGAHPEVAMGSPA